MRFKIALCWLGLVAGTIALAAGEPQFYRLKINGLPAGHMRTQETEDAKAGLVTTEEESLMRLRRMKTTMEMRSLRVIVETADGRPVELRSENQDKGTKSKCSARFSADASRLEIETQDVADPARTVHRTETMAPGQAYPHAQKLALLRARPWVAGGTFSFASYSLDVFALESMTMTCGGEEEIELPSGKRQAWKFEVVSRVGTTTFPGTMWLDGDAQLLKSRMHFGGILQETELCTKSEALGETGVAELTQNMILKAPFAINPRDLRKKDWRYEFSKKDGAFPVDASPSPVQALKNLGAGRWSLEVRHAEPAVPVPWPYAGQDPQARANLVATSTLQLGDERLKKLAVKAAGQDSGGDAYATARRVARFVHRYIKNKNYDSGYATAAEVAESGSGDCTEHSVLTVALCRILGIPARPVVGLGYTRQELEAGVAGGYFVGHQWCEVWIDGRWYPVDAAMSDGFDAGHIRFVAGDGSDGDVLKMVQVLEILADLKMEKAEPLKERAESVPASDGGRSGGRRLAEPSVAVLDLAPAAASASPGLAELARAPGAGMASSVPAEAVPPGPLAAKNPNDWRFTGRVSTGFGWDGRRMGGVSIMAEKQMTDHFSLGLGFASYAGPWWYPPAPGAPLP